MTGSNYSKRAVRAFTPKQKVVWQLVMRECKTEQKAADILGVSRDVVHDRLLKARHKFKKLIVKYRREDEES